MPDLHPAERYLCAVHKGDIPVSPQVRKQVARHFADLLAPDSGDFVFDRTQAERVIAFFSDCLAHLEGEWAGQPFDLLPWQQGMLWILYGWRRRDTGTRRYRFAYVLVGRGNGKTGLASGLCLYEMIASGEAGAQVYSAATDRKTAKILFDSAQLMVLNSPWLRSVVTSSVNNLCIQGTASKFEPCAAEDSNLMGLRPSFVVLDELHAHASAGVWNAFYSAMGKRRSSLLLAITNAGYDRNSVCWRQQEYSEKVLDGVVEDPTWFSWICTIGQDDNWEDESCWIKSNPSLGELIQIEEMRQQAKKAREDPSSLNAFLRFRLSIWTTSHTAWIPLDKWDACGIDEGELLRLASTRRCSAALDLSTTTDISALVLLFEPTPEDDRYLVLPRFFLPRENIAARVKRDRVPYDVWERQGRFVLTDGNVIDYRAIRQDLLALRESYEIREVSFDRWNSSELVTELSEDGFEMVRVGQGFADMQAPTKRLMELVLGGRIAHGRCPVLRWMASNVIVKVDPAGNIKPDKGRSREKIDGIVAIIMALSGVINTEAPATVGMEFFA